MTLRLGVVLSFFRLGRFLLLLFFAPNASLEEFGRADGFAEALARPSRRLDAGELLDEARDDAIEDAPL